MESPINVSLIYGVFLVVAAVLYSQDENVRDLEDPLAVTTKTTAYKLATLYIASM